jgi:hypothetical protein
MNRSPHPQRRMLRRLPLSPPNRSSRAVASRCDQCQCAATAGPDLARDVPSRQWRGPRRHDRPGQRLRRDLDDPVRQGRRCGARQGAVAPRTDRGGSRQYTRGTAIAAGAAPRSVGNDDPRRHERDKAVGRCPGSRNQGARRIAARPHRGDARTPVDARHRASGDHRLDRAIHRIVRHRVGHHGQLHRYLAGADDEPRRGRAGHRRGTVGHRRRIGRSHPAVVIYNGFVRAIGGYRAMLADLAASVQRLVSRELDAERIALKAAAE